MVSTDVDASQQPAATTGAAESEPRTSTRRRRRRGGGGGGGSAEAAVPAVVTAPAPAPRAAEPRQRSGGDASRRKSEGKPLTPRPWRDGRQRVMCSRHRTEAPLRTPVVHRTGLATRPLVEIDRDGQITLVCDQVHPGPCEWPGETVGSDRLMALVVLTPGRATPARADERHVAPEEPPAIDDDGGYEDDADA